MTYSRFLCNTRVTNSKEKFYANIRACEIICITYGTLAAAVEERMKSKMLQDLTIYGIDNHSTFEEYIGPFLLRILISAKT